MKTLVLKCGENMIVKMNFLFIVICLQCLVFFTNAQNDGNCTIEGISDDQWKNSYQNEVREDTDEIEKIFKFTGNIVIVAQDNEYLKGTIENSQLIIRTTEQFKDLEKNEPSSQYPLRIRFILTLKCDTSINSIFTFVQPIIDINTNPPEFNQAEYKLKLPMPFMPNVELSYFNFKMFAKDIDSTNTGMSFKIDPSDDFSITYGGTDDELNKEHKAVITAKTYLSFTANKTYQITATDVGTNPGPLSSTTTLIIEVDEENSSIESPKFSESYYTAVYVNESEKHTIKINENITLTGKIENVTVELKGNSNECFNATLTETEIKIIVVSNLQSEILEQDETLVLTISAKNAGSLVESIASLIIDLPKRSIIEIPKFTKPYYDAVYKVDGDHQLNITAKISFTKNFEDLKLSLDGTHKDNFHINYENNEVKIIIDKKLSQEDLNKEKSLILGIYAKIEGAEEGSTALVIYLPKQFAKDSPTFDNAFYGAVYSIENDVHNLQPNETINLIKGHEGATVKLSGTYAENFKATIVEKEITITKTKDLQESVINEENALILTIHAIVEGAEDEGKATFIISLPKEETNEDFPPKFSKPSYIAEYEIKDGVHSLDVKEEIKLEQSYENAEVSITGTPFDIFDVKITDDTVKVTLKGKLPQAVLDEGKSLILNIIAKVKSTELQGSTALVVFLPKPTNKEKPEFVKPHYTAYYKIEENNHSVEIVEDIALVEDFDNVEFSLDESYTEYFEISKVESKITLSIKKNLSEPILEKGEALILTINAQVEGIEKNATTALIIYLPLPFEGLETPKFTKLYYTGEYNNKEDIHKIEIPDDILLIKDNSITEVTITGEYASYFEHTHDKNKVIIQLNKNFEDVILLELDGIVLGIHAKVEGVEAIGSTTLLISVPYIPYGFELPYYVATYENKEDPHKIVHGKITLLQNMEDVTVSVSGSLGDSFNVTNNNGDITVVLNKNLPDDLVEKESVIMLELVFERPNLLAKYATLAISLPKTSSKKEPPEFEKAYYIAQYVDENEQHEIILEQDIILTKGIEEKLEITLNGKHAEYFNFELNDNTVNITLKKNLDEDILNTERTIILSIDVKISETEIQGSTALVVSLPGGIETSEFTQPYYTAKYVDEEVKHTVILDNEIAFTGSANVSDIKLDEKYSKFFNIEDNNGKINVGVKENLPEEILSKQTSLILEIHAKLFNVPGTVKSTLIINLPSRSSDIESPEFEKIYYEAVYLDEEENDKIVINGEITLIAGVENSTVNLLGDYSKYFECTKTGNKVNVELIDNLPQEVLNTEITLPLVINAQVAGAQRKGKTVIIIKLPKASDVTTPGTTTTTTIKPEPEQVIEFDKTRYQFHIQVDSIGKDIGRVLAKVTPKPEVLLYEIIDASGQPASNIMVNQLTGILTINGLLVPGHHYYTVTAKGQDSGVKATAEVEVVVDSVQQCGNDTITPYSLLTVHILEEQEDLFVLSLESVAETVEYIIFNEYPQKDLFEIRPDQKVYSKNPIDREAEYLSDMLIPQFTLTLQLKNKNPAPENRIKRSALNNTYADGEREWIQTDNLRNLPKTMTVAVIIDDINDNPPIFENTNLIVGYPKKEVALKISPPYLTKVTATDKDVGYNARIVYKTDNNRVIIHPTSGIIYPTEEIFEGDFTFEVKAIDQEGNGQESKSLNIDVKLLTEDHISLLITEKLTLEDVDKELEKLSSLVNLKLFSLTSSVVPIVKKTRATSDYYLRIVTYALDVNNNPVSSKTLEEKFNDAELEKEWIVDSWESGNGGTTEKPSTADEDDDNTGLIAAVGILAVLLGLILIGGIAFYFFKIRKPYSRMDLNSTASNSPEPYQKNTKMSTGNIHRESTISERRPTGFIYGSQQNTEEEEADVNKERKKSVVFNENIEKISEDVIEQSKL